MTKTSIIIICIFCLIMAGVIALAGYNSYDEYRANTSNTEMGKNILGQSETIIEDVQQTITWVKNKLTFDIGEYFEKLWLRLKQAFIEAFDWIPGVDFDDDENEDNDFNSNAFPVPNPDGIGGGGGGARD